MDDADRNKNLWEVVYINKQQIINEMCNELGITINTQFEPTPNTTPILTQVATQVATPAVTPAVTPTTTPAATPVVTPATTPATTPKITPASGNKLMLPIMPKLNIEADNYTKYSKGNEYHVVVSLIGEWLRWKKQITNRKQIFPCKCKHHFIYSTQYIHFKCVSLGSINRKLPSCVVSIIDEIRKKQYPSKSKGCDICKTYLCSICSYNDFGLLKEGQISCTHPYHL